MEVLHFLVDFFSAYGYLAVFVVLVACGLGIPVPEDITLISGGVICAISVETATPLELKTMIIVAFCGVLIGDLIMFFMGSSLGPKVTRVPFLRKIITENIYSAIQEKAHRYGNKILFIARFLPGLRAPIFLTAGMSHKVPVWKFILFDGTAALISVPILVYLGFFFANDLEDVIYWVKHSELLVGSIVAGALILLVLRKIYQIWRR